MSQPLQIPRVVAAAVLFDRLWAELVTLLGTPATAALLRRAVKRAQARRPGAALPEIFRDGLAYQCALPDGWRDPTRADGLRALRELAREELHPLLRELTGPVVLHRLAQFPELVEAGLAPAEDAHGP